MIRPSASIMFAAIVLCVCLVSAEDRSPQWSWRAPARIEWAELTDCGALLAATASGDLFVLDAASGRSLLDQPIHAGQGVRLAPAAAHAPVETASQSAAARFAYCFDRRSIYAIELGEHARLRWSLGERATDQDAGSMDPEFLPRIVAAVALDVGVITFSSDGTLRQYDAATGSPRWDAHVEKLADPRLAALDNVAMLLGMREGRIYVVVIDASVAPPRIETHDLAEKSPIWSTYARAGAVLVQPDEILVFDPRRIERHLIDFPGPAPLSNPLIALVRADALGTSQGLHLDLIAAVRAPKLCIAPLDFSWEREFMIRAPDPSQAILRAVNQSVLLVHSRGVEQFRFEREGRVRRVAFVASLMDSTDDMPTPRDATVNDRGVFMFGVDETRKSGFVWGPLNADPGERDDVEVALLSPRTRFKLPDGFQRPIWTANGVLLLSRDELIAYDVSPR